MRCCPRRSRTMSDASSRTRKCREMAGCEILKGSASSPAVASPSASRPRIARRVGSESAEKVMSSLFITIMLYNKEVICQALPAGLHPQGNRIWRYCCLSLLCHSRGSGNPAPQTRHSPLDSRLRGNDGNREVGEPRCDCPAFDGAGIIRVPAETIEMESCDRPSHLRIEGGE